MIYFITAREVNRVKIGFSDAPRIRFMKMRTDSPMPLALERVCEGDMGLERDLHQRFASDRRNGEWFDISPAIETFMASLPYAAAPSEKFSVNKALIALGVAPSTASMMVTGSRRVSIPLAIALYRATGWKHDVILLVTEDEMAVFEKHEPWVAPRERGVAA